MHRLGLMCHCLPGGSYWPDSWRSRVEQPCRLHWPWRLPECLPVRCHQTGVWYRETWRRRSPLQRGQNFEAQCAWASTSLASWAAWARSRKAAEQGRQAVAGIRKSTKGRADLDLLDSGVRRPADVVLHSLARAPQAALSCDRAGALWAGRCPLPQAEDCHDRPVDLDIVGKVKFR